MKSQRYKGFQILLKSKRSSNSKIIKPNRFFVLLSFANKQNVTIFEQLEYPMKIVEYTI